jgi:glycosyltransferase involved in cell wall biosynthesis
LNFTPFVTVPEKETEPLIIFSGRLKKAKRPDHVIHAFRFVKRRIPSAKLWILGEGPFRSELEKIAGDGIRFFGHLDNSVRRELIKRGWVLVNPGIREGWGLNVIEANALGVPCVGYCVPGLKDSIKDGQTGLLVEPSIQTLATAIIEILNNQPLRMMLSENALEYSKTFSWDTAADTFMRNIRCQEES